jgi:transcriptional repressor NrdR
MKQLIFISMTYREMTPWSIDGSINVVMRCPSCSNNHDRVLDTREQKEGQSIRRRRECLSCKTRFTTVEEMLMSLPYVIKKDGRREPFLREKLGKGIQAACQKRPIGLNQIEGIVERVSQWVASFGEQELSTELIGTRVIRELKALDDVAYVRFASVYKTFRDIQEFVETLEEVRTSDEAPRENSGRTDSLPI